ncbi:hypothetical protein QAD02_000118 [Eretmocerus hayati]|uniref:Uncharacterized protein n=1 Tax=Eretmocerus hayati TaxID=131215 RepID=A0ACC2NCH6_9HYME|nr:hypothetical protein QAD02_000118 [Eretmocerus hayati]
MATQQSEKKKGPDVPDENRISSLASSEQPQHRQLPRQEFFQSLSRSGAAGQAPNAPTKRDYSLESFTRRAPKAGKHTIDFDPNERASCTSARASRNAWLPLLKRVIPQQTIPPFPSQCFYSHFNSYNFSEE